MRQRLFFFLIGLGGLAVIWPFIFPLALGATLGHVCEPLLNFCLKKTSDTRLSRWSISVGIVLLVLGVFLVPLSISLYIATNELVAFLSSPGNVKAIVGGFDMMVAWGEGVLVDFDIDTSIVQSLREKVTELVATTTRVSAGALRDVAFTTPGAIMQILLALLTWMFFLVNGQRIRNRLLPILIPWPQDRELVGEITSGVLKAIFVANVLVALIQAIFVTLFIGLTGVPRYILWGVLSFFMSFVPVFGTFPIMGGAALYLFTQDHPVSAIVVLVGSATVAVTDNLLRPFLLKGSIQLNFFWVLIAILGGLAQFGLEGAVLGPLFFSLFMAYLGVLEHKTVKGAETSPSLKA